MFCKGDEIELRSRSFLAFIEIESRSQSLPAFIEIELRSRSLPAFSQIEGSDPDLSSIQIDGSDLEGNGLSPPVPVPLLCSPTHWNSRFSIIFSSVSLVASRGNTTLLQLGRPQDLDQSLCLTGGSRGKRQHLLSWVIGSRRILIKIGPKPVQLTDRMLMRQRQAQIQTSTEF